MGLANDGGAIIAFKLNGLQVTIHTAANASQSVITL